MCVFHEFRRNLYITLAKYLEQEGIADELFSVAEIMLETLGLQGDEKLGHASALGQLIRSVVDRFT